MIADKAVAASYYSLLQTFLGVDINLSKSLVSDCGAFEFAKRLITLQGEFTPLGPKNLVLALKKGVEYLPSLFIDGLGKGDSISAEKVEEMLHRLTPDVIRVERLDRMSLRLALLKPFGIIPVSDAFGALQLLKSFSNADLDQIVSCFSRVMAIEYFDDFLAAIEKSLAVIRSLRTSLVPFATIVVPFGSFPSYYSLYASAVLAVAAIQTNKYPLMQGDFRQPVPCMDYHRYFPKIIEYLLGKSSPPVMVSGERGTAFSFEPIIWKYPKISHLENFVLRPIDVRKLGVGRRAWTILKRVRAAARQEFK